MPQIRRPAPTGSGKRVAGDRTRHAAWSASTAAQLAAGDAYDVDAGVLELCVGLDIALVGDGQPGRDRQRVVAVIPLLAFGRHRVETGVDDAQRVDAHRLCCGDEERLRT